MKILCISLFMAVSGIGTAQAQLASDSPAPLPPANSLAKARKNPFKLVSEMPMPDSLRAKSIQKVPFQGNDKNQKMPSEMEAPKRVRKG